jgi:hypothetical protein
MESPGTTDSSQGDRENFQTRLRLSSKGADEHLVTDADGRLCSQETLQERERPCIYKSIAPVRQPVTVALFDGMS